MWVEELILDNIKCFDKISIRFGETKKPYQWITLLGENGTGKSTVLSALALLMAGPEGAKQLAPRPEDWPKDETRTGKMTLRLHQGPNDPGSYGGGKKKERKVFQYTFHVTGSTKITLNNKAYTEPAIIEDKNSRALPWLRENALLPKGKGWFGAGYGAFRRLTRESKIVVPSLQDPLRYTNFYSQFKEDQPLEAFQTWMVYLDYKISKTKDALAQKQKEWGIDAINALLPEGNKFDSIDEKGNIIFDVFGSKVSTVALSDGFRSILALTVDLIWRLIEAFPESEDPLKEQGVVLIDELDIHLHPTWQRTIAGLLRKTFPSIQFIMATHSPLVVAGAGLDALTYRFVREGSRTNVELVQNIQAKNVDDILKSDAFGLVSTFSPEVEQKIEKYLFLRSKKKLSSNEQHELQLVLPWVQDALGPEMEQSDTEKRLNNFIEKNYK
jgi:predicted ATPase